MYLNVLYIYLCIYITGVVAVVIHVLLSAPSAVGALWRRRQDDSFFVTSLVILVFSLLYLFSTLLAGKYLINKLFFFIFCSSLYVFYMCLLDSLFVTVFCVSFDSVIKFKSILSFSLCVWFFLLFLYVCLLLLLDLQYLVFVFFILSVFLFLLLLILHLNYETLLNWFVSSVCWLVCECVCWYCHPRSFPFPLYFFFWNANNNCCCNFIIIVDFFHFHNLYFWYANTSIEMKE